MTANELADRLHHELPTVLRIDAEHAGEMLRKQADRIEALERELAEANKPPTRTAPCARFCEHTAFVAEERQSKALIERLERENAELAQRLKDMQRMCLGYQEEHAELRKDAERYRWLKTGFRAMSLDMGGNHTWVQRSTSMLRGPNIDEAIDAAMQKEQS